MTRLVDDIEPTLRKLLQLRENGGISASRTMGAVVDAALDAASGEVAGAAVAATSGEVVGAVVAASGAVAGARKPRWWPAGLQANCRPR